MNLYSTRNGGGYQRKLYSDLASAYTSFGGDFARDLRERGDTGEYAYNYLGGLLRMGKSVTLPILRPPRAWQSRICITSCPTPRGRHER